MPVRDLDSWVLRFNNREMPIFSRTVSRIKGFSPNDRSSINELTQRILEDVALTIKVLKLANSAFYKPDKVRITTVHWALMRLGYSSLGALCTSAPLVEELLHGPQRERVIRERVKTLHGAIQARSFAAFQFASGAEEVFIAASLMRLGPLMFYCFGGEAADELERCLNTPGYSQERAEREVLGFRLDALTAALARDWNFSTLLHASIERQHKADPRVPCVLLGHSLAENVERGWDSPQVRRVIQVISGTMNRDVGEITHLVHANAQRAMQVGRDLGLTRYLDVIPPLEAPGEDREPIGHGPEDAAGAMPFSSGEAELWQELSTLLQKGRLDINLFFSTLLEGIIHNAGMDRVLLALLTPDHERIAGKYGIGWEEQKVVDFLLVRGNPETHVFERVMKTGQPMWINGLKKEDRLRYLTPEVTAVMATSAFFLMPVVIKNQAVGLICADRGPSGRELDEESFAHFARIHRLAQEALSTMV